MDEALAERDCSCKRFDDLTASERAFYEANQQAQNKRSRQERLARSWQAVQKATGLSRDDFAELVLALVENEVSTVVSVEPDDYALPF